MEKNKQRSCGRQAGSLPYSSDLFITQSWLLYLILLYSVDSLFICRECKSKHLSLFNTFYPSVKHEWVIHLQIVLSPSTSNNPSMHRAQYDICLGQHPFHYDLRLALRLTEPLRFYSTVAAENIAHTDHRTLPTSNHHYHCSGTQHTDPRTGASNRGYAAAA